VVTSGCCASHSPSESAERVGNRSTTWLRYKSTSIVPKVLPLHHAQSSTPRTRMTWGNAGRCAALLTCRISVSALTDIPSLCIKRWPGRPPRARPTAAMTSPVRLVCCAYGEQTLERRSVKIRRSQPALRQRQRPRCSRRITCVPWTGRSCRERQIPAMARARNGLATRTDSRVLAVSFHDPTLVRLEHAAKRHLVQI
jgi:hypothetical protein